MALARGAGPSAERSACSAGLHGLSGEERGSGPCDWAWEGVWARAGRGRGWVEPDWAAGKEMGRVVLGLGYGFLFYFFFFSSQLKII